MRPASLLFLIIVTVSSCKKSGDNQLTNRPANNTMYFPPTTGATWETTTPKDLGWNENELNKVYSFLEKKIPKPLSY